MPFEQARAGPTPVPRAEDLNSDQSKSTEERLQRVSVGKGVRPRNPKAYENINDSMDEVASPLFNRLDSQNSYRNAKQVHAKIK